MVYQNRLSCTKKETAHTCRSTRTPADQRGIKISKYVRQKQKVRKAITFTRHLKTTKMTLKLYGKQLGQYYANSTILNEVFVEV